MEENKFDFKFLNKLMYIGAIILVFFALQSFGLLEKIGNMISALTPLFVGIIICWVSKPIANKLRKLGLSKGLAATIALVIIFAIVGLALAYIIPVLITELTQFVKDIPSLYSSAANKLNILVFERFNAEYRIPGNLSALVDVDTLFDNAVDIVSYSINTAQKTSSFLIGTVTAIMISFFMVKDMDRTKNNLMVTIAKNNKDSNTYKMLVEMDGILNSYIRGLLIDSFVVGIMEMIVCMILGLKYAVIFGILIFFLNLIPYVGAFLSHLIVTLYALTIFGPVHAIITLACSFGVQLIDANILQPNIIGKSVKLHPVLVISGMLVFESVCGVLGMIIAMPLLAIAKIYLKYKFNLAFEIEEDTKKKKTKKVTAKVKED